MRHQSSKGIRSPLLRGAPLFALILSLAGMAGAVEVPAINIKSLTSQADLICVGGIVQIREHGTATIHMHNGDVAALSITATLNVEQVLKGQITAATVDFGFLVPQQDIGYSRIAQSQFGIFFLRMSDGAYTILNSYHPYVVAVPGIALGAGNPFGRVIAELDAVLGSPTAPVEAQREAVYTLALPTQGEGVTAALLKGVQRTDPDVRLNSMALLLEHNDLTYLDEATELLLHPPPDIQAYLITSLALGVGAGVRSPSAIPALRRLLNAPDVQTRRSTASALGLIGTEASVKPLMQALSDSDRRVRYEAISGLAQIAGDKKWDPDLRDYLNKSEEPYLSHWQQWAKSQK